MRPYREDGRVVKELLSKSCKIVRKISLMNLQIWLRKSPGITFKVSIGFF